LSRVLRFFRLIIQFVVKWYAHFLGLLSLNSYCLYHLFSQIHDNKPKICTKISLDIYIVTPLFAFFHFSVRKWTSSWNQTTKLSHICTQLTWCEWVRCLNYSHFFVRMYECDILWHTISWKQPTVLTFVSCPMKIATAHGVPDK
jgi:hypothetical protein